MPEGAQESGPLSEGDLVGERYRVLSALGTGGMGVVYKVEHVHMAKEMALKLLRPELSETRHVVERFEREARSASRLDDPHIVRVTDFGRAKDGSMFLVMELLDGMSLSERIAAHGAIPYQEAIDIAVQVLTGLEHAHANDVIHRDLKPDNIMLRRQGDTTLAKILDFGIAKITSGDGDKEGGAPLTQAGMVFGTPRYMSPEQASGEPVDHRADLYSVGILLFEMLTGRPPFQGESAVDILTKHITQAPPQLKVPNADPKTEKFIEAIVLKALAKSRSDRFQSASDFKKALIALSDPAGHLEHTAVRSAHFSTGSIAQVRAQTETHHRPWIVVAALLVFGLAVGLLSFGDGGPQSSSYESRIHAALSAGDLNGARAMIAQAAAETPDDKKLIALRGHLESAEGDYARAADSYRAALAVDPDVASDGAFQENLRGIARKESRAASLLLQQLFEVKARAAEGIYLDFVMNAPSPELRRVAYHGLEQLGEADQVDQFAFLAKELEKHGSSCKIRQWYVRRLVDLQDERALPIFKKELYRKGGFLNLESVNDCMAADLKRAIRAIEGDTNALDDEP